jgi:tripartite-type tricarboxylate transporter receptor subunit TctC
VTPALDDFLRKNQDDLQADGRLAWQHWSSTGLKGGHFAMSCFWTVTRLVLASTGERMRQVSLAILCVLALAGGANAQTYPARPIVMIVPFGAGGPTDVIARLVAKRMSTSLGQSIVVENVGGAAGSIGVGKAAHAAPDGYTLSIGHYGTHAVNSLIYPLHYNVVTDFEPIILLASNPYVIVSSKLVPSTNLKELIAWLKANPDKASIATNGPGSAGDLIGRSFEGRTGIRLKLVPYRGGSGSSMQDLLAGHISLKIEQAAQTLPMVRSGQVRGYAVTATHRLAQAPGLPTVDEAGLPGFYFSAWHGLWVPKGTPAAIVATLNAAARAALADPSLRERLTGLGQDIPPKEQQAPAALAAQQKAEIEKWAPIIKAAHIKVE